MDAEDYNGVNLGYILKCGREDSDLSQRKVMELTGINNKTLSGYENNVAEPDFSTLLTLCRLYGISLDSIIYGTGCSHGGQPYRYKVIDELPGNIRDDLLIQANALHEKYCK